MQSSMYIIVAFAFIYVLKNAYCDRGTCGGRCCLNYIRVNGSCEACPPGSIGLQCSDSCPADYYGLFCEKECNCNESERCDKASGCVENLIEKVKIKNGNDDKNDGGQSLDGVVIGSAIGGSMLCALILSLLV